MTEADLLFQQAVGALAGSGRPRDLAEARALFRRAGEAGRHAHFDAIPGFANQRVLTMLVWLNDGYEGGETFFATPGLSLRAAKGDAILFRNAGADGRRDPDSTHAGRPVTAGEKLIASRWIRERRFELPVGRDRAG